MMNLHFRRQWGSPVSLVTSLQDELSSRVTLAIVHHANQYLICDGYDERPGISEVVGSAASGLAAVLNLHRQHRIPANLHVSGTFAARPASAAVLRYRDKRVSSLLQQNGVVRR